MQKSENVLEMRNVSVVKEGTVILDSVDLDIRRGESVVIIGPNGSGKTTLIKLLRGDILPYYDEESPAVLRLFGEDRWNIFDIRRRMGIVSMDLQSRFDPGTTVSEVILSGFFSSMDVFRNHVVTDGMRRSVLHAAARMGLDDLIDRPIGRLSLGEMRRTLISRALTADPEVLVLDEPMTGLDISMRSRFRSMFDMMIERGAGIVMVTHELEDIPVSVDRVVMIKEGRILADGGKRDVLTSENLSELYGESIKAECDGGVYRMHLQ